MTATTEALPRIETLDLMRGIAVMGILAMNIVAFAMPFQAYMNPLAYGGAQGADLWAWAVAFVFVDGKMRAMFSLLFGASMLLVLQRAAATGQDPGAIHFRRMAWLLAFGLIHFFFIWFGDILSSYALVGLVAYLFATKKPRQLMKWSLIFFGVGLLMFALAFLSPLLIQAAASAPDADPGLVAQWGKMKAELGVPPPSVIREDIAVYSGSWLDVVRHTFTEKAAFIPQSLIIFGPETLALMLLGMWGLKSGFLKGTWETRRYALIAAICLGVTVPVYALLAYTVVGSGFETGAVLALAGFAPTPLRPVMTIGYAALIILLVRGGASGWLGSRIAAAGRAAFTNYLGTSLIATFIFYGWGLGLYGTLGRAEVYLVVLGIWVLMLVWSKLWLERYRYGPLEWLWRSLSRGSAQPMRKLGPAQPAE